MGNYHGTGLYMYLSPRGCRIIEGSNKAGSININKFFTVRGLENYFIKTSNDDSPFEISNMSSLVKDICDELKNRHVKSKKVFIVSNCFGVSTEIDFEKSKNSLRSILTSDIGKSNSSKNKKNNKKDKITKNKEMPGVMTSKTVWGDVIINGELQKYTSITSGDKFLLKSLVQEFYHRGYDVICISNNIGQLFNLRYTEQATFDNQGKIIIDLETNASVITMLKDIPIKVSTYNITSSSDLIGFILATIKGEIESTGRNPKIYVTGDIFDNVKSYDVILQYLIKSGYDVYDMFDRKGELSLPQEKIISKTVKEKTVETESSADEDADEVDEIDEMGLVDDIESSSEQSAKSVDEDNVNDRDTDDTEEEIVKQEEKSVEDILGLNEPKVLTPDYSICLAAMLVPYSKQIVNVAPPAELSDIIKRNSDALAKSFLGVSVLALIATGSMAGLRLIDKLEMKTNPSRVSSLDIQIQDLQATKTKLEESLQILTQADVTILDVISFVNANQSSLINVISIDTKDMLTVEESVETNVELEETDVSGAEILTGSSASEGSLREPIIIRGYAKTGNAALEYYDKLFKSGLPQDPILNGLEKYKLPDGTETYIFEIQIGGDLE